MPSSVTSTQTILGKGARITLHQPVPFVNTESSKQTVRVTGRRSFAYAGDRYLCSISAQVPKQDTVFFSEGTVFDFNDKSSNGKDNTFSPKKGSSLSLSCFSSTTGEQKNSVTLEEAQTAFPKDVLVIEQSSKEDSAQIKRKDPKNEFVDHLKKVNNKYYPL